jgi:apolipoprotein N-acyltransferase
MIPFALFGMAGGLALFWGSAFALARRFNMGLLGLPALWTSFELLRGYIFTGFPWALPAYIWLDTAPAQVAAWLGPYGLTAVTFSVGALLARAFLSLTERKHFGHAFLSVAVLAGLFAAGHIRQSQPLPKDLEKSVRVVQPNAEQRLKWHPDYIERFYQTALDLSAPDGADLVIWPETSVAAPLYAAQSYLKEVAAHAYPARAVVGLQRVDGMQGYNSAVLLNTAGEVDAIYDKRHLVPFGEYMPLPELMRLIGLRSFTAQAGYGYSSGTRTSLFDAGALGMAQPLICYEAIFPRALRQVERPDWLLQITNDAWFGTFSGPQQSLAQSRFRSIESGLPLVRAANTGVSAIIDARGDIRASIPLGEAGGLTQALPQALRATLYARLGELPILLMLILWLLAAYITSLKRKAGKTI